MKSKDELITKIEELAGEANRMNENFISNVLQAILDVHGKRHENRKLIPLVNER
jgi:hypothetical protein